MDKRIKVTKIFLIVYGGIMAFFGIWCLLIMGLMRTTPVPMKAESIWIIYMPILTIIGLSYLFLGINLRKIQKRKLTIYLIICGAFMVWLVLYLIAVFSQNMSSVWESGYPAGSDADRFHIVGIIFGFASCIIGLGVIIIPQIIIGKKLYKIAKEQIEK